MAWNRQATLLISIGAGLALVTANGTAAGAATGGNFILGKANTETTQATLTNSKGIALKLAAPAGTAPLKVSNSTLVAGLNAQYLSGMTAPAGGHRRRRVHAERHGHSTRAHGTGNRQHRGPARRYLLRDRDRPAVHRRR